MKLYFTIFFSLIFFLSNSQDLKVNGGTSLFVKDGVNLYADINLLNEGTVEFGDTGNLILDGGFDNQNADDLILSNAILKLGSDTSRADGSQTAIFGTDDEAKKVELGMQSGSYDVNDGLLSITETFTSNSGTLNASDNVVLKSTSIANTAIVQQSSGGTVNGIRVQRFIPASRAFRFLASPVNTISSSKPNIFDNWQQGGLNLGDQNYRPNVGTQITGGTSGNGFDQNNTGNPSLFTFDNSSGGYTAFSNAKPTNNTPLETGQGYYLLVRGDRSINLNINDTDSIQTTLETTGSLEIGNVTPVNNTTPGNADGFVLVANPYQAPVDLNDVITNSTNIDNTQVFVWDPKAGSNFTKGAFGTLNLSLSNITPSFPAGSTNVTGSEVNDILQPGQSVFLKASNPSNAVTVNFQESDKVNPSNLTDVFSDDSNLTTDGYIRLGLYAQGYTPFVDVAKDGFIVHFDDSFDNAIDQQDASKMFANSENMAITLNNDFLSINSRKLPSDLSETIDIFTQNLDDTQYTFSVDLQGLDSLPNGIMLWDKYQDKYTNLSDQQTITFSVDQSIPEASATDRFALVFENETLETENQDINNISLYPNPVIEDDLTIQFSELTANDTDVVIFSQTGQKVYDQTFTDHSSTLNIEHLDFLSAGAYILNVQQGDQAKSFTIIKK